MKIHVALAADVEKSALIRTLETKLGVKFSNTRYDKWAASEWQALWKVGKSPLLCMVKLGELAKLFQKVGYN